RLVRLYSRISAFCPAPTLAGQSLALRKLCDAGSNRRSRAKSTTGAAVRTLDDVVSDLDLKSVDFLKLDVDGYEVQVLRGARNTLRRFGPVIFFEHAP